MWRAVVAISPLIGILIVILLWQQMRSLYLCARVHPESAPPPELTDFFGVFWNCRGTH
ncbi:MAG: hypothetical protein AAFU78_23695 [Cyanobacteria bacterium J06633_2]